MKSGIKMNYLNPYCRCPVGPVSQTTPHVSDPKQGSGAARHGVATAHRWRASPAVTSTRHDPHDLLDTLTYLAEPLDGATHGGGTHGGTAGWDDGGTSVEAMALQPRARTSIYEL